ncbi:Uncharacterised protein [Mycobacterium tuberculosis]|nr:Uncharacterised protein [Mycobacterium tuberculosis]
MVIGDQLELFTDTKFEPLEPNEMRRVFGPGPEGKRCKTCVHLLRKQSGGTYLKCSLRTITNGAGTDHRAGWKSCAKYTAGRETTKK